MKFKIKPKITITNVCVVATIIYFVFLAIKIDFSINHNHNHKIDNNNDNNCANLHWNIDSITNLQIDSVYNYKDENNTHKIFYFTNYFFKGFVKIR